MALRIKERQEEMANFRKDMVRTKGLGMLLKEGQWQCGSASV